MKIHYLQHVPFEGLGSMEEELRQKDHSITATHLYEDPTLPEPESFDWLIVMGGPMGVYDEDRYPWLVAEKQFIRKAIDEGKTVLGICLGAQLIADVLGAKVLKNPEPEIGWFPIQETEECKETILSGLFAETPDVFHWHGDTFEIPNGAQRLAFSKACNNQGFILDNRIIGLQFHLETTEESAKALINHCSDDLIQSPYVQTAETMLNDTGRFSKINLLMNRLLELLNK